MSRFITLCMSIGLATVAIGFLAVSCTPQQQGCNSPADCPPNFQCVIATGQCVECLDNESCGDGTAFCCNGSCTSVDELESKCGCSPDPAGATGESCEGETPICQENGQRVGTLNADQGVCGCPCNSGEGGTVCQIDEEAEQGFVCSCDRTNPVGTCEAPVIDEDGVPHKVADACNADESCVCIADNAICTGANSDCTSDGCVNLKTDVANCGVPSQDCINPDSGVGLDGECRNGGCLCDAATDCEGDGLNVDSCAFVGADQQCVCDDYEVDGEKAACPMELECVTGGCSRDGEVFATEADLLAGF